MHAQASCKKQVAALESQFLDYPGETKLDSIIRSEEKKDPEALSKGNENC